MSIALMNAAWSTDLPLSAKFLLVALADQANDQGECYPSIALLRKRCSMGERTVQDQIDVLVRMGYLLRSLRNGRSTVYKITNPRGWRTPAATAPPTEAKEGEERTPAATAPPRQPHPAAPAPGGAATAGEGAAAAPITTTQSPLNQKREGENASAPSAKAGTAETDPATIELPPDVERKVWDDFRRHFTIHGGWSPERESVALEELWQLSNDGTDCTRLLKKAISRGMRDLGGLAAQLAREGTRPASAAAAPRAEPQKLAPKAGPSPEAPREDPVEAAINHARYLHSLGRLSDADLEQRVAEARAQRQQAAA